MKIVIIFTLACLACVLTTQGFAIGDPEDERTLVKRFIPFGIATTFVEAGCKYGPLKCNDHILNPFRALNDKVDKEKEKDDKDKDAKKEEGDEKADGEDAAAEEAPAK